MINLPIPDVTTSTGSTLTTVGQVEETETMASAEFLAVWNNAPEREPVPMPGHGGVDIARSEILVLLSKQLVGGELEASEPQAELSIIMDIPPSVEQVDRDMPMGIMPQLPHDTGEIPKGLDVAIDLSDVLLPPTAPKPGPIMGEPVKGIDLIGKPIPVDPSVIAVKETAPPVSPAHVAPAQGAVAKDDGRANNRPGQSEFSGADGAIDDAVEIVMPIAPARPGLSGKNASLENNEALLTQVVARQPVRQDRIANFGLQSPQEPGLPILQNQIVHGHQVVQVSKPEPDKSVIKSNASPPLEATALQSRDRPQKAEVAKRQPISQQDVRALPEPPKPLSQMMVRDQTRPEIMLQDQSKVSQPNPLGPEYTSPVGRLANNQAVAGVVDVRATAVAAPDTAPSPKRGDRRPMENAPSEATRITNPGADKPAPASNQAMPVTIPMASVVANETLPFDSGAPFEFAVSQSAPSQATGLSHSQPNAAIAQPEIPRHIARQLADVARQMPERPVELTLNPHELGRVRLTFTLTDGGINVSVLAERGETMELMRRHIETLAQEFREMGYADVGFRFSQQNRENTDGNNAESQARHSGEFVHFPENENIPPARVSLEPTTGLDLRL